MENLNKQVYIYSLPTDAFYSDEEYKIHIELMRFYTYRNRLKDYKVDCKKRKQFIGNHIANLKKRLKTLFASYEGVRTLRNNYLKQSNVIGTFDSTLTRTLNIRKDTLSEDIMVVEVYFQEVLKNLIANGYLHNGERFIYFSSSAGQIRTKKGVFIKESVWNQYHNTLSCGLSVEDINRLGGININKYQAYLALTNSASVEWSDFDIDRCIVVDDLETNVFAEVDYIDRDTYEITRQKMNIPIEHTDGCGMMLPSLSDKAFMTRLPWVKGLLVPFPFDKFANEHNTYIVKDIYGKEWDIVKDGISIIFTKSQFKMWKFYKSWDEYKAKFKLHNCKAAQLNEEDVSRDAKLGYQYLQTLTDMTNEELTILAGDTIQDILNVGSDKDTMLRLLGATETNLHRNPLQEALYLYPELLNDEHSKQVIKDKKKSMIKDAKSGKLNINGKYTFIIPDLYAACEKWFLSIDSPNGLLKNGEVYCGLYESGKVDIMRSPQLYREHPIRKNVVDDEKGKWFITNGIYTSVHDPISKMLQFDNDGDKVLVTPDETLIEVAERNMKGIVPLYYEMAKAEAEEINSDNIYRSLTLAYKANIGEISNNITKIWNSHHVDLDVIKWLCMENNFEIDYAKTLFKPARPKEVDTIIKQYIKAKVPHFFIYAKDKENVEPLNDSVVNRLDEIIPNKRINFKNVAGKLDYKMLMKNNRVQVNDEIIQKYIELDKNKKWTMKDNNDTKANEKLFIYRYIRKELLKFGSLEYVTDVLVKYLYNEKKSSFKTTLWESFGDQVVRNIKRNVHYIIECVDCGCVVNNPSQRQVRCDDCQRERVREKDRLRKKKQKVSV